MGDLPIPSSLLNESSSSNASELREWSSIESYEISSGSSSFGVSDVSRASAGGSAGSISSASTATEGSRNSSAASRRSRRASWEYKAPRYGRKSRSQSSSPYSGGRPREAYVASADPSSSSLASSVLLTRSSGGLSSETAVTPSGNRSQNLNLSQTTFSSGTSNLSASTGRLKSNASSCKTPLHTAVQNTAYNFPTPNRLVPITPPIPPPRSLASPLCTTARRNSSPGCDNPKTAREVSHETVVSTARSRSLQNTMSSAPVKIIAADPNGNITVALTVRVSVSGPVNARLRGFAPSYIKPSSVSINGQPVWAASEL